MVESLARENTAGDCSVGTNDAVPLDPTVAPGKQDQCAIPEVGIPDRGPVCSCVIKISAWVLMLLSWTDTYADEGGASFWLPGQFATLSAQPPAPGWSVPASLYYYSGSAPDSASSPQSAAVAPGTRSQTTQLSLSPTYAPESKVLGGQLALFLSFGVGGNTTEAAQGGSAGRSTQTVSGLTDITPGAALGWTRGTDNWMVYLTGGIPVGTYESQRLANVGIGHSAIDTGGAYTYDNSSSGLSLSAAIGFTYNFENYHTDYRNGIDSHLGWSAMQSVSATWRVGLAGYAYYQLTGDSGSGDTCGPCKSRVASIGPQVNYTFTVAGQEWSANLRGYYEFWAQNRLEGYALFATLSIPLGNANK